MIEEKVEAILNINNLGEYECNSINWEVITEKYPNLNVQFIDFLFDESNSSQYFLKINEAAEILN